MNSPDERRARVEAFARELAGHGDQPDIVMHGDRLIVHRAPPGFHLIICRCGAAADEGSSGLDRELVDDDSPPAERESSRPSGRFAAFEEMPPFSAEERYQFLCSSLQGPVASDLAGQFVMCGDRLIVHRAPPPAPRGRG